jgi:hypothetical protein
MTHTTPNIRRLPLATILLAATVVSLACTGASAQTGRTPVPQQDKLRVAVFPFAVPHHTVEEGKLVRNRIRAMMEQTGRYDVMSETVLQALTNDLGLANLEECQTPSCLSVIGSRLGVQQVFQGSLEREDTTTVLRVILINVADSKVLLSRRIVLRVPIQQLTDDDLKILAQDFNALTMEAESTVRWYYVAGAVLVAGVTIYLASRGVFDRKEREFEHEPPQPPPPPPGN